MKTSGISGNEFYCLTRQGFKPGEIVVGNSVYSLGVLGSFISGIKNIVGGEVSQITEFIKNGRELAIDRMEAEAEKLGETGITDVGTDLIQHVASNNIEFLSIGSGLFNSKSDSQSGKLQFSSSIDGSELFCNSDAGYDPKRFVFGNVAYAIGAIGGIMGMLRTLGRGEVKEYSEVLNLTRHLALNRIVEDAKRFGANSVLNIETKIMPYPAQKGITEMVMIGTASNNPALPQDFTNNPITSDLTASELWSITNMGYIPVKMLLGTSVYSLGVVGGVTSMLKSFVKGEINELTTLVYEARENAIGILADEAKSIGADDIIGTKTYMYEIGNNLIEFMAIGTAIKKVDYVKTKSSELIPQAIIVDKNTFVNASKYSALGGLGI